MDRNQAVEAAKLRLRQLLQRANLSVGRDPASRRLARTLAHLGVDTVIDVGANVGQFGALLRGAGFEGRIISIEPLTDAYRSLERRARRDRLWETHNLAVGERSGRATIHVAANSYSSSLLDINSRHLAAAPASRTVGSHEVSLEPLSALAEDLHIAPERSLLKIDTQGYESKVLLGAAGVVERMAAVQLELSFVTLYDGQELFEELRARMTGMGFSLFSLEPGVSDDSGRLLQCDGLFVRESSAHRPAEVADG